MVTTSLYKYKKFDWNNSYICQKAQALTLVSCARKEF